MLLKQQQIVHNLYIYLHQEGGVGEWFRVNDYSTIGGKEGNDLEQEEPLGDQEWLFF